MRNWTLSFLTIRPLNIKSGYLLTDRNGRSSLRPHPFRSGHVSLTVTVDN
jgi:hypothetical protein